jgi:hypothetical protein
MRAILITTAIIALPLMALGQGAEPPQPAGQGQTKENQEAPPAKKKRMHTMPEAGQTQAKPETATGKMKKTSTSAPNSQAKVTSKSQTKVNVQEFKSTHKEVFALGQHPKEFFVERFGANHFRLIGNTYFVFVDGCWVAVDVAGFVFVERVICEGDPDFIVVY